ncbi:unnamed protein product [Sphagnum jensenii]|uniref:Uncharacterized protein n=1 Tax=Sphagnum jensenii TaxID=128206 RepID=A0ABP0X745_9BRYO|nr:hypothetical protein CY35_06G085800 [Sphagnum magellanicum]KAH9560028.1 hypothetical protein CY35_06G085800 [Sphagnum magellanicum]KAH9560029.1 hypothetical protein CY35_06G085800 [Sphagnum magellanicum]
MAGELICSAHSSNLVLGSSTSATVFEQTRHSRGRILAQPKPVEVICKKRERGERESPLLYHVTVVSPPPRHLGIHSLPPNTQCGETVEVKGELYVVSGVTYRYQLRRGKYEPRQKRLDVQSTGRYFLNLYLDNLLETS